MIMNNFVYDMEIFDTTNRSLEEYDFVIVSSGSDRRAYRALEKLSLAKSHVVLVHFDSRLKGKTVSNPIFDYKNLGISLLTEITCDIKLPGSSFEQFNALGFKKSSKIAIDISCFTKPFFYYVVKLLKEMYEIEMLTVFYTEPKSYFFERGLFRAFHSSHGPIKIIEMPGYKGQKRRGSIEKLVILLGFDGDLSKKISEALEPTKTVLINGFPAYSPKFKDISLIVHESLVSSNAPSETERAGHARRADINYASANNPFDVYNALEKIKKDSKGQEVFLNIAPLGTKPMALGACLFALHNPDVRVVYPMPEHYDDTYSDECWKSWIYTLPLSI